MWTRAELKEKAKIRFKANYWVCVLVALIMGICAGGSSGSAGRSANKAASDNNVADLASGMSSGEMMIIAGIVFSAILIALVIGTCVSIFVMNPLAVGCYRFFNVNRNENAKFNEVGSGFKNNYMNNVKVMFLMKLFVALWSLLLIIPGIIKGYEYMMIPYLLADNPNISSQEAFAMSKKMMDGQKWNAFVLDLSFIGWWILTILTFGVLGIFYVAPYVHSTKAELYYALKEN